MVFDMKVTETVKEFRDSCHIASRPLGLVPTMGYLHEGHMALIHRAKYDNSTTAVSIFVNPTQFHSDADCLSYPRDIGSDLSKLEKAGIDIVFVPSSDEIYPAEFDTNVDVGGIANKLEGSFRPGHFKGVSIVVCKLLSITRSDRVYFGQKDAQQCLVVKRLSADLNLGAEVVVVPTVRDVDGLAFSSRNIYLTRDERKAALVIPGSLSLAKELRKSGIRDVNEMRIEMCNLIMREPLAKIDYISVADPQTMDELVSIDGPAIVSLAVHIGKTRLIDNVLL